MQRAKAHETVTETVIDNQIIVDTVDLGRVQPKDIRLVRFGQLFITKLFAQFVANLESFKGVDDPLW